MRKVAIHLFGGTSDAVKICEIIETMNILYTLSVATQEGFEMASSLKGKILVGRLDALEMAKYFRDNQITHIIDATHPFATMVSDNIIEAAKEAGIPLLRYERQTQIDDIENTQVIKVSSIDEACSEANRLGKVIFLTTGSKDLASYCALLKDKKIVARVLPTPGVMEHCFSLGLGIDNIIAMKGPFTEEMNRSMYECCQADVVITKESGKEGGFTEKVFSALELGIPVIVIKRVEKKYEHIVSNVEKVRDYLRLLS